MQARDLCTRKPQTIDPDASVREAAKRMEREKVGCLVVTEDGTPVGMLTDRDAALTVLVGRLDAGTTRVRDVMNRPVQIVDGGASLDLALSILRSSRMRRLPVVEGGALIGLLAMDDVIRLLATEVGELAEALRRQLASATSALEAV
jgi:CBS domain-containing protein